MYDNSQFIVSCIFFETVFGWRLGVQCQSSQYLIYSSTEHPVCAEALKFGEMLQDFSHYHGQEELSLAISNVNYLLQEIKIQGRKQSRIDDHFFVEKQ